MGTDRVDTNKQGWNLQRNSDDAESWKFAEQHRQKRTVDVESTPRKNSTAPLKSKAGIMLVEKALDAYGFQRSMMPNWTR